MIYRIKLSISYHDVYIDFTDVEDAASFATTLIEHYKQPVDEDRILKVTIEVLFSNYNEEEDN